MTMIRLNLSIGLTYEIANQASDFIFNIHAAQTKHQTIVTERLDINAFSTPVIYPDPVTGTRFMRLKAGPGQLGLRYTATVDIDHYVGSPALIGELPVSQLPPSVLPYLYPSRYCQSDR